MPGFKTLLSGFDTARPPHVYRIIVRVCLTPGSAFVKIYLPITVYVWYLLARPDELLNSKKNQTSLSYFCGDPPGEKGVYRWR